jgi:hypothetical protein
MHTKISSNFYEYVSQVKQFQKATSNNKILLHKGF